MLAVALCGCIQVTVEQATTTTAAPESTTSTTVTTTSIATTTTTVRQTTTTESTDDQVVASIRQVTNEPSVGLVWADGLTDERLAQIVRGLCTLIDQRGMEQAFIEFAHLEDLLPTDASADNLTVYMTAMEHGITAYCPHHYDDWGLAVRAFEEAMRSELGL